MLKKGRNCQLEWLGSIFTSFRSAMHSMASHNSTNHALEPKRRPFVA